LELNSPAVLLASMEESVFHQRERDLETIRTESKISKFSYRYRVGLVTPALLCIFLRSRTCKTGFCGLYPLYTARTAPLLKDMPASSARCSVLKKAATLERSFGKINKILLLF